MIDGTVGCHRWGNFMENVVCVMIASFNGEQFISEQIDSILNQEGIKPTILVRDDGSTDSTVEVLESYKRLGDLDWYSGEHLNVAKGFLSLIQHAPNCEYYAFCDQDDVWDLDKLKIAVERLSEVDADKPALYCCGSRLVNRNLEFISEHRLDTNRTPLARLFFSGLAGNTMVFNRALKEKLSLWMPQHMRMHDTWTYKTCLCLGGKIIIDSNPHLAYRQHGANIVGMELTLRQKLKKFWGVLNEKGTLPELQELFDVYGEEMIPKYKGFLDDFLKCRNSLLDRIRIAFCKDIDFNNSMFNLAFKVKILLGIL